MSWWAPVQYMSPTALSSRQDVSASALITKPSSIAANALARLFHPVTVPARPAPAPPLLKAIPFIQVVKSVPRIGSAGQLVSSAPSQTSQDLTKGATYTGYAVKTASAATQLAGAGTAAAGAAAAVAGVVVGILNLAAGLTANPKTGIAKEAQQSQITSAAFATATSTAVATAALAVSTAAAGLATLVLLPVAAFFTAQSLNDADNAKRRALRVLKEYHLAAKDIGDWTPFMLLNTDYLASVRYLGQAPVDVQNKWLTVVNQHAAKSIETSIAVLPQAFTHLANGETFIGIPGRSITDLQKQVDQSAVDAYLLWMVSADILARRKLPVSGVGPPYSSDAAHAVLLGTANASGFIRPDLDPQGYYNSAMLAAGVGGEHAFGNLSAFQHTAGRPFAWGGGTTNVEIDTTPTAALLIAQMNIPGYMLPFFMIYHAVIHGPQFRGSAFWQSIHDTFALRVLYDLSPPSFPEPKMPMNLIGQHLSERAVSIAKAIAEEETKAMTGFDPVTNRQVGIFTPNSPDGGGGG